MKQWFYYSFGYLAVLLLASGCLVVGGVLVGAAAIHIVGPDSVEASVSHPIDQVWDACVYQLSQSGTIERKLPEQKKLEGKIASSTIKIQLESLSPNTTKIHVAGRKNYDVSPDVAAANQFLTKVITYLK